PTIDDPSNPIETGEDHFIDMVFGIYYRIVNNLFADVGIGSYGNSVYGLYKVRGSDEPVWCNIDGSDGVSSGFALQAGLLYSFRWIYISAGYRRYFSGSSTSTFYGGAGISINIPKKYFNK
ncbi:MAG: hypothetical protein LBQ88_20255, partial [Treponema sp.]|nr:hypothetical protein [Treponema sp.]